MLHDRPTVSSACVGTIFVLPVIIVMSDSESPTASERFHISKCMCLLAASQQCFGHVCLMLFFIQDVTSAASSDAEDEAINESYTYYTPVIGKGVGKYTLHLGVVLHL